MHPVDVNVFAIRSALLGLLLLLMQTGSWSLPVILACVYNWQRTQFLQREADIVSYILLFVAVSNSKILQVNLVSGAEVTCEIFDTEIVMLDFEMSHHCGAEIAVSNAIGK